MSKTHLVLPSSLGNGHPIDSAVKQHIKLRKRWFFATFNDRSPSKAKTYQTAAIYTATSLQAALDEYIRFHHFLLSEGRGNPVFASLLEDIRECARVASEQEGESSYGEAMEGIEDEVVEEMRRQLQLMAVDKEDAEPKGKSKRSRDEENDVEVTKKVRL